MHYRPFFFPHKTAKCLWSLPGLVTKENSSPVTSLTSRHGAFYINVTMVIFCSRRTASGRPRESLDLSYRGRPSRSVRLSLLWRIAFSKYLNDDFSTKRLVPLSIFSRSGFFLMLSITDKPVSKM